MRWTTHRSENPAPATALSISFLLNPPPSFPDLDPGALGRGHGLFDDLQPLVQPADLLLQLHHAHSKRCDLRRQDPVLRAESSELLTLEADGRGELAEGVRDGLERDGGHCDRRRTKLKV